MSAKLLVFHDHVELISPIQLVSSQNYLYISDVVLELQ